MAIEIEAKLRVTSHVPVREALRHGGATFISTGVETNRIYDRPDGSLRRRGCALRVRSVVGESGAQTSATMTAKGPAEAGPLKSREEAELTIEDPAAAERLVALLGFKEIMRFAKRRESWTLGDCRVELDTLPYIGTFVEIEGPDVTAVTRVQARLGLGPLTHLPESYMGLLRTYAEANGVNVGRVEFEAEEARSARDCPAD